MEKFLSILKLVFNLILFCIYSLFAIILGDFLYGVFLTFILWVKVPGSQDPIHMKIAIVSVICMFLITILWRRFFYIEVFEDNLYEDKKSKTKKEKMQIYVNKEVK